ncbi:MAG: MFS transporter [Erysipelothrix sp.]|nr:MFS transporter [Erysipelothrix sp.]
MIFGIIMALWIQFIVTVEMSIVMPLAPQIAQAYNVDTFYAIILNIGFAVFGVLAPLLGYNGDKYGIKKMLLGALTFFILGAMIVASIQSIAGYVIGRSLLGLAFFTVLGMTQTYIIKSAPHLAGPLSGVHRIVFALGVFTSPWLGQVLVSDGSLQLLYNILTIVGIVTIVLTSFVHEIQDNSTLRSLKDLLHTLNQRVVIGWLFAVFLNALPAIFFFNYLSIYLNELGLSGVAITNQYTLTALGSVFGGILIVFITTRFKLSSLLKIFLWLPPLMLALFITQDMIWFPILGLSFGLFFDATWGMVFPYASTIVPYYAATFLTLISLVMAFTNVVTTLAGAYVYQVGGFPLMIWICVIGGLIGAAIQVSIIKKKSA